MCDTIAATAKATASGSVLFGKNSDRDHLEPQLLQLCPARRYAEGESVELTYISIEQARETHAVLLSRPCWMWGAEIGANSFGLCIGNEAIFSTTPASAEPGVIGMDYLRLGLERARNVDEAIDVITRLLARHGQSGNCGFRKEFTYHNSYLLADPNGVAILETVDRDWVVRSADGFDAISNAITTECDFRLASARMLARKPAAGSAPAGSVFSFREAFEDSERAASGQFRQGRAMSLLASRDGELQPHDFFRVLRDHEEGPSIEGRAAPRICAHTRTNPIGSTTASWVAELGRDKHVHWVTATAAPCTGVYKPLLLEAGLPAHGPWPARQADDVSLWWCHETMRLRLEAAKRDVQDIFHAERADLEESFLVRMTKCPAPGSLDEISAGKEIVQACWREALEFENRWSRTLAEG